METTTKKFNVIMLPSEKDNEGYILAKCITNRLAHHSRGNLVYGNGLAMDFFKRQDLYFTSDDEIKEGDWYVDDTNMVRKSVTSDKDYWDRRKDYKKIVATTNKSLRYKDDENGDTKLPLDFNIPQIDESFIEDFINAYNVGKPITEVNLEGGDMIITSREHLLTGSEEWKRSLANPVWMPKTTENGFVIIKSNVIKTGRMYSQDEVEKLIIAGYQQGAKDEISGSSFYVSDEWIEKNLK